MFTLDLLSLPAVSKALAGHAKYGALHKLVAAVLAGDVAGGNLLSRPLMHLASHQSNTPLQQAGFCISRVALPNASSHVATTGAASQHSAWSECPPPQDVSPAPPAAPDASRTPRFSPRCAATRAASTPAALEAAGPGVSAEGVLSKARMTALLVACSSTSSSAAGSGEVALAELQKVLDVPADQVRGSLGHGVQLI